MHGALTSGSDLQYLAELLNWFCLPGGSVHGQWGAVHLEASRGRWHHHLAPTFTPRRKWTGAPITPNCQGGMCVCVRGGSCFEAGTGNCRQTDRQTGLWFVTAVFTDRGPHLIGHAVITLLHCDPSVIQGFCLQPEVALHGISTPNPLSELWPQSPCPQLIYLSPTHNSPDGSGHQYHLLPNN